VFREREKEKKDMRRDFCVLAAGSSSVLGEQQSKSVDPSPLRLAFRELAALLYRAQNEVPPQNDSSPNREEEI